MEINRNYAQNSRTNGSAGEWYKNYRPNCLDLDSSVSALRPIRSKSLAGNVGNLETIRKRGSRKITLCCRFGASEVVAGESVTAFRARRATGVSWLEAGRPRLRRRLLGRRLDGTRLTAAAKRFRRSCRAESGGTKLRPGSVPAERLFPALAPRATRIPSVRGPRRRRRNGSSAGLRVSPLGSNRVTRGGGNVNPSRHQLWIAPARYMVY